MYNRVNLLNDEFANLVTESAKKFGLTNGVLKSAVKSLDKILRGEATYLEKGYLREVGITERQIAEMDKNARTLVAEGYVPQEEDLPLTMMSFSSAAGAMSEQKLNHAIEDVLTYAANIYDICSNFKWSNVYFKNDDGKFEPLNAIKVITLGNEKEKKSVKSRDFVELFYKDKNKKSFIEITHLDSFDRDVMLVQVAQASIAVSQKRALGKFYGEINQHMQTVSRSL